jgi:hypothetical protein
MATFTKLLLSGSSQGRPIKVAATTGTGTVIHATGTSASVIDEVWLYATNSDSVPRVLTVQLGGATSPDDEIKLAIPPNAGMTFVLPGLVLTGSGSASASVTAIASAANVIMVSGYVHRIS